MLIAHIGNSRREWNDYCVSIYKHNFCRFIVYYGLLTYSNKAYSFTDLRDMKQCQKAKIFKLFFQCVNYKNKSLLFCHSFTRVEHSFRFLSFQQAWRVCIYNRFENVPFIMFIKCLSFLLCCKKRNPKNKLSSIIYLGHLKIENADI